MGVALSACSLPQTRRLNFDLPDGEMEIGMGIHGEPGIRRGALKPADAVADEIMDAILAEMKPLPGVKVAVLVNSLGSTPLMELYILYARVAARLGAADLKRSHRPRRPLLHLDGDGGGLDHDHASG